MNNKTAKDQANVGKNVWPPLEKIGNKVFNGVNIFFY